MDNIHTLVRDKVYDLALDVMDEANFEIIVHGEFTPDQFANAAARLAECMAHRNADGRAIFREAPTQSLYALGLTWQARNSKANSWVRVYDGKHTGFADTVVAPIFSDTHMIDEGEVGELLDLMDTAWTLLKAEAK